MFMLRIYYILQNLFLRVFQVSIKEYGTQFEFARLRLLHVKNIKKSNMKRSKWVRDKSNNTSSSKDDVQKNSTQQMVCI